MEYLQPTLIIYAQHTMVAQMDIFTLDDIVHVKIMSTIVWNLQGLGGIAIVLEHLFLETNKMIWKNNDPVRIYKHAQVSRRRICKMLENQPYRIYS